MMENFPADSDIRLEAFTSSHFSNGILPRIRGILEARRQAAAINHITGDVHYLALGLPGKRTLLTIHDCGLMNNPNPLARRILKWLWLDIPVRHCRYVTAVSEATRQDIIRHTGCDPDKIVVIPTIITDSFRRADKPFNRQRPRILHIGLAPNKNLERHAAAISGLDCELHIIGKLEPAHRQLLDRYQIRYTSEYNINQEDMQRAYAECDLLLFASTLEGFGMPIIEAQTVGRPVITSNISSMPEVAGDAACLVDPFSIDSIRNGLVNVIGDSSFRESLVKKGFLNCSRFSAPLVARQYEALYHKLINT
jgi:glycosyltransferase involved in cell wall biosynthesis